MGKKGRRSRKKKSASNKKRVQAARLNNQNSGNLAGPCISDSLAGMKQQSNTGLSESSTTGTQDQETVQPIRETCQHLLVTSNLQKRAKVGEGKSVVQQGAEDFFGDDLANVNILILDTVRSRKHEYTSYGSVRSRFKIEQLTKASKVLEIKRCDEDIIEHGPFTIKRPNDKGEIVGEERLELTLYHTQQGSKVGIIVRLPSSDLELFKDLCDVLNFMLERHRDYILDTIITSIIGGSLLKWSALLQTFPILSMGLQRMQVVKAIYRTLEKKAKEPKSSDGSNDFFSGETLKFLLPNCIEGYNKNLTSWNQLVQKFPGILKRTEGDAVKQLQGFHALLEKKGEDLDGALVEVCVNLHDLMYTHAYTCCDDATDAQRLCWKLSTVADALSKVASPVMKGGGEQKVSRSKEAIERNQKKQVLKNLCDGFSALSLGPLKQAQHVIMQLNKRVRDSYLREQDRLTQQVKAAYEDLQGFNKNIKNDQMIKSKTLTARGESAHKILSGFRSKVQALLFKLTQELPQDLLAKYKFMRETIIEILKAIDERNDKQFIELRNKAEGFLAKLNSLQPSDTALPSGILPTDAKLDEYYAEYKELNVQKCNLQTEYHDILPVVKQFPRPIEDSGLAAAESKETLKSQSQI